MKFIYLLLLIMVCLVASSQTNFQTKKEIQIKHEQTIEESFEAVWNFYIAGKNSSNQFERVSAWSILNGVKDPESFDDPSYNEKLYAFLESKLAPFGAGSGCIGSAVTCYNNFLHCVASLVPPHSGQHSWTTGEMSPDPSMCINAMNLCMQGNCGGVHY